MVAVEAAVRRPEELRRARHGVALTFLVTGVVFGTWSARLPAIRHALELSEGGLGVAFMGLNAGAVVGLQLGGALVPRTGSRAALRVALPAYAAALAGPAVAGDLAVLTLSLFVLALANSVVDVAMNAHGVAVERGVGRPVMSGFHAMLSLGVTVGAALGALAAAGGLGRTSHFLAVTAAGVAVAPLATRLLLPSRADAARPAERAGRRRTVGAPARARPAGRRGTVAAALLGGWSGRVVALGVLGFCLLLAEGSANDWAAVYLRDGVGATAGLAAVGVAGFSAAMTAGRLAGDRVAARLGPVAAFRGGALLAGGGFGVALLVGTPAAGLAGLGLFGAGLSLTFPLAISAAGHLDGSAATAVARVSTLGYLGAFVGPGVIGALAARFGLPAALAVPAALVAATALAARKVAPAGAAVGHVPAARRVRAVTAEPRPRRCERRARMNVLMVRSKVKADRVADVEAAIEKVFSAIQREQPAGVRYASSRLQDGVTFVALLEVEEGVDNPLPSLPAFLQFQEELKELTAEPPTAEQMTVVGTYRLF
jgi:Major Facilitator Superfamily